jgi:hypothetical protein
MYYTTLVLKAVHVENVPAWATAVALGKSGSETALLPGGQ